MDKVFVQWLTITSYAKQVAKQVEERGFKPDAIIPILRGGMVPAAILSDLLNVKTIYPVHCSSYDGMVKRKYPVVDPFTYNIDGKEVLIVDDVLDTGDTFEAVQASIKRNNPKRMMCASLMVRENSARPSFWSDIAKEGAWIVFPWELNEFKGD